MAIERDVTVKRRTEVRLQLITTDKAASVRRVRHRDAFGGLLLNCSPTTWQAAGCHCLEVKSKRWVGEPICHAAILVFQRGAVWGLLDSQRAGGSEQGEDLLGQGGENKKTRFYPRSDASPRQASRIGGGKEGLQSSFGTAGYCRVTG